LNLKVITGEDGLIDESAITIEEAVAMQVFNKDFPFPGNTAIHLFIVYAVTCLTAAIPVRDVTTTIFSHEMDYKGKA
jgi:hypothetical protein